MEKILIIITILITIYIIASFIQYIFYQFQLGPKGVCNRQSNMSGGGGLTLTSPSPRAVCYWHYRRTFWEILLRIPNKPGPI